jgi:hypothetical protein
MISFDAVIRREEKEQSMRPTKLALSALAIAVALGGPAYAAISAMPAKPAASSSTQTAQASPAPAKHRLFHRKAAKQVPAKASTSNSTSRATTGVH